MVTYVLGGLGGIALVTGSIVAAIGFAKRSDLDVCKPRCNPEDVDGMRHTFVASDILVGVGILSLAAAAYFYFSRPSRSLAAEGGAVRF
jgi:hypothetical protein